MANKRTVITRGKPEIYEDGTASAAVRPGYLVAGVTSIAHHGTAGANAPRLFALERDELGTGIDNTYQDYAPSAYYASGDRVKVAACYPGCEVTAFLASGQTVAVGGFLESAGDGTLNPIASGTRLAFAVDAVAAGVASVTAIRVRIM